MKTAKYDYSNEKRFQGMFNLKERPERFTNKEFACKHAMANEYHRMLAVLVVDENSENLIEGYYVVRFKDAEKVVKDTDGAIQMLGAWEVWNEASKN